MTYLDAIRQFTRGAWFRSRPRAVQEAASLRPPFLTYRHGPTNQLCRIESYGGNADGTCTDALVEWFDHAPTVTNLRAARLRRTGRTQLVRLADLEILEQIPPHA